MENVRRESKVANTKPHSRSSERKYEIALYGISIVREDKGDFGTRMAVEVIAMCWSRVRHLEEIGVIKHYSAVIDHVAIGLKDIVFIEVTLDKHDEKVLSRFGDALAKIPEVIEANLVTGDYDYLVKVAVADTTHYERFLREKLYRIQGIRHTRSTFSLRTLKLVMSADPLLVNAGV